jgi:hypothetical protein
MKHALRRSDEGEAMNKKTQPTHEMPGGQTECTEDDGVVNDSLGTVDPADFTGVDDEKGKGDAKKNNTGTRED